MTGLHSWTRYEKDIKRLKQFFDYTLHLYYNEVINLRSMIKEKKISLTTSIGATTHHVHVLNNYMKTQYPEKLRELVLISLISDTEVYFVRLIKEIYRRDISLFKTDDRLNLSREELFSNQSIYDIGDKIIGRDCRKLTSGGIKVIQKYFKKNFSIDFNNLVTDYKLYLRFYDTRHLIVHANGIVDNQFKKQYRIGDIGERIILKNEDIINAFDVFKTFGYNLRNEILKIVPDENRKTRQMSGAYKIKNYSLFMLCFVSSDPESALNKIKKIQITEQKNVEDIIVKIFIEDGKSISCVMSFTDIEPKLVIPKVKKTEGIQGLKIYEIA